MPLTCLAMDAIHQSIEPDHEQWTKQHGQGIDFHRHQPGAWLPCQGTCNLIHWHQNILSVGATGFNSAFLQCPERCKSQCPAQTIGQQDGPRMLAPGLWAFSNIQLTWQNTGRATHVCCVSNMLLASHSICCIMYTKHQCLQLHYVAHCLAIGYVA